MKWAILCIVAVMAASCSTERFVKKQVAKNPQWFENDTTYVQTIDTVELAKYVHDTTFQIGPHDTVVIDNDTLRIEVARSGDKLRLKTTVKPRKAAVKGTDMVITRTITITKRWIPSWIQRLFAETWVLWLMGTGILVAIGWIRR